MEFGDILDERNYGQAETMKWVRDRITDESKKFDWF